MNDARRRSSCWFVLFAISAATAFATAAQAGCEPDKLAAKYPGLAGKTLKLSISADLKPLSYRDPDNLDNLIGFSPDQARAVFACVGAPFDFVVGTFSGGLAALIVGKVDAYWGSTFYTPERAQSVDLVTFMIGSSAGVVPKGNPKNIQSLNDLCGLRAVAPVGGIEVVKLNETNETCLAAHRAGLEVITATDRPSALRLLDTGRADLLLGQGVKQAYDPALYVFAFVYANNLKSGIAIQKGNKDLEQAIYDAFAVMHAEGADKKLLVKYEMDPILSVPPEILER